MASNFGDPPKSIWEDEEKTPASDAELEKLDTSILAIETIDDWNTMLNDEAKDKPLMLVTLVAQWFKPVMSFLGVIHDLSLAYPDVIFAMIDIDESPALVQHLKCMPQPGMILYMNKQKATEFTGINAFNNPPEMETILRFEFEKRGAKRVEVSAPDVTSIIQQAIQLAKPGANSTLKLRNADAEPPKPAAPTYKYFPNQEYQVFSTTTNMTVIESKLLGFAKENQACALAESDASLVKGLIAVLADDTRYSSSNFEDGQLELLQRILETWPRDTLFPALDLFRLAVLHPIGRAFFVRLQLIPTLVGNAFDAPFPYQFMVFKTLCNLFDSRITKQLILDLFEKALKLCTHLASTTNKNLQLVISTTLLNYATFFVKEQISDDVFPPTPLLEVVSGMLSQNDHQSDDALFRLAITLGTLSIHSPIARQQGLANLLTLLQAQKEAPSEHTKIALDDLQRLAQ